MRPHDRPGLLFVVPSRSARSASVDARLLAVAGLTEALGKRLGGAEVLTPGGLTSAEAIAAQAVRAVTEPSVGRAMVRRIPQPLRPAVGDFRAWRLNRRMRMRAGLVTGRPYRVVLQLHHRFQDAGQLIARQAGVPLVLRIEALETREEAAWGIRRPGYGWAVERLGELPIVRDADLVASVSNAVDAQLDEAGIPSDRRLVLPNGVDVAKFFPGVPNAKLRRTHGLEGRFVVGWVGGFRPFHGLSLIPEIARRLRDRAPDAVVCLVGAGPLRERLIEETRGLEHVVRILPPVPHQDVPSWLRSFDTCLLLADEEGFHYSPMKLYEYLACGKPVIATRLGQVDQALAGAFDEWLVPPGDADAIAERIRWLAAEPTLRETLGSQAREIAERSASWEARAEALLEALAMLGYPLSTNEAHR